MKVVSNAVFAALVVETYLLFIHILQVGYEVLLLFVQRLPRPTCLFLLYCTILQVYQQFDPIVVGFLQQSVGGSQQEVAIIFLDEFGQQPEVLDMEGH